MKTTILFSLIFTILVSFSQAQTKRENFRTRDQVIDLLETANPSVLYLFDDFRKAQIYYPNRRPTEVFLNYSLLQDIMISRNPQGVVNMLSTRIQFDSIVFVDESRTFIFQRDLGYLEKTGDHDYFVKHSTDYRMSEVKSGAYGASSRTGSIENARTLVVKDMELPNYTNNLSIENPVGNEVDVSMIYTPSLVTPKGNTFERITSRRDLNRLFPNHRSEIRDFLRRENITFDLREDQIKLAAFLGNLD